jgi:hypothetical protein
MMDETADNEVDVDVGVLKHRSCTTVALRKSSYGETAAHLVDNGDQYDG